MSDIISLMRGKQEFVHGVGASPEAVDAAEKQLELKFTDEYRKYVETFGTADFVGYTLTGVCPDPQRSVAYITDAEKVFTDVPEDWYVIEQGSHDAIVIWQAADGKVYETHPFCAPNFICNSLSEYITL